MRKYIYIAFLLLLYSGRASAQFTLVSGTVTDSSGLAYACATLSASIVNLNGQSLYLNGAQFSPNPSATKLGCATDPSTSRTAGFFSVQVADNTQIKCGSGASIITCATQTQWLFTVNAPGIPPPLGTGPQVCTAQLTISGSSQNISGNFSTCPILSNAATSIAVTPTVNAIYASPACPPAATNCFQINDDGQIAPNATYTSGSATVTTGSSDPAFVCAGAGFPCTVGGDAGKISFAGGNCNGVQVCSYDIPQGTITTVNSAHSAVTSQNASRNSIGGTNVNFFLWGHDDGAQLVAAFAVAAASGYLKKTLFLPCGVMFTSVPPFIVPSTSLTGGGLAGCSPANSIVVALPRMNCQSIASISGCLFTNPNLVANGNGQEFPNWRVSNITFAGFYDVHDAAATYTNPAYGIVTSQNDELDNVWLTNWNWNAPNIFGMFNRGSLWINSGSQGGGGKPCLMNGIFEIPAVMMGGFCANSNQGPPLTVQNNADVLGGTTLNLSVSVGVFFGAPGFSNGITNNSTGNGAHYSRGDTIGCSIINNSSGSIFVSGSNISQGGCGDQMIDMSAGAVHLSQVQLIGTGTVIHQTGGTIFDECGNLFSGTGTAGIFTGGAVVGTCSLTQASTNTAVASRNTTLASTQLLPTVRWPGPSITIALYAYDSAAGSGCTGNTTVTWTISYTDLTGTAQTSTATETITTNGGATGGDALKVQLPISVNPNTLVNYSTTYAIGTGCVTGPSYAANLRIL